MTEPRIVDLPSKKLAGMHLGMTLKNNRTAELWRSFMPRRKDIPDVIGTDLISMQVYEPGFRPQNFTPDTLMEKWATVEVSSHDRLPPDIEPYHLQGGLYAVFLYKGRSSEFKSTWEYIFMQWLPASGYEIDQREHFEVIGEKYRNDHPDSEEEIWIPVKKRE